LYPRVNVGSGCVSRVQSGRWGVVDPDGGRDRAGWGAVDRSGPVAQTAGGAWPGEDRA